MARIDYQAKDPAHFEKVLQDQAQLRKEYDTTSKIARICPICGRKAEVLCRGYHSGGTMKCPLCGHEIFFPPVYFRTA